MDKQSSQHRGLPRLDGLRLPVLRRHPHLDLTYPSRTLRRESTVPAPHRTRYSSIPPF